MTELRPGAGRFVRAVASRPDLWPAAAVALMRLAPAGWWHRWPPVPVPDPAYWRFRMETQYGGDGDTPAQPEHVLEYLEWCAARSRRRRRALR